MSKKGVVKTVKMMYNVCNTYYTTLFRNFQEETAHFLQKERTKFGKQKGGSKIWKQNFKKRLEKA